MFHKKMKKIISYALAVLILLSSFAVGDVYAVKVRENEEYKEGKTLRPISIMFHLDRILEWEVGKSPDDDFNRASVPLRERFTGHVVNPLANEKAKVQSVPLMNSKNDEDNSVNGDEFDAFAFDFWQYVDQMVFWDGPVPTADIIDAGHRNGVPVYGTLFFNWSNSFQDREIVKKFLVKKKEGGKTIYPVADKLIDIVEYYGFDGYFINQETSMNEPWGKEMRDFMLYAQRKAKERGGRIRFSWYDAMTNNGYRTHYDAVTSGNDFFIKRYNEEGREDENGQYASDEFFMNFNWTSYKVDSTVNHMRKNHRDPFDAYAGFELQQNSYNTNIGYGNLLDKDGKLKVSLGLYTPDSIRGLAKNAEDYHEQERNFWVGFDGDPTTSGDTNSKKKKWRGIARFVADKSVISELPFNTFFNTGHGKQWFIDGQVSKDAEWNSRGVQDILPTWRWWIRADKGEVLRARYDFDDAYNSGNSIRFEGAMAAEQEHIAKLYSTRLPISKNSKLKVSYRGGLGSKAYIGLATAEDYRDDSFEWFEVESDKNFWWSKTIDISKLSGQTVYAIAVKLVGQEDMADYGFNLGQIALFDSDSAPAAVENARIDEVIFRTSKNAEARISWEPVDGAEYYEVYQENADETKSIINATSGKYFYAEHINRTGDMEGTTQKLYVVSVGKNGVKSEPTELVLDWKMLVSDTEDLPEKSVNLCLNAKITGVSGENKSEPARNALNGTINGNTDKWCQAGALRGYLAIDLGEPKTVRRVAVYHAEAGGEGDTQNTKDFTIQYKDGGGEWRIAHSISDNRQGITDFDLKEPITAKEWKLDITHSDRSAWTAIRIYEWQMFEQTKSKKTDHIPMRWVEAKNVGSHQYQIKFKNVPINTTVKLYEDKELQTEIASKKTSANAQDLIFDDVKLKAGSGYGTIYYTSQADGKEESIRMALVYPLKNRELAAITLLEEPTKKIYAYGSRLNVKGGKVQLDYDDDSTEEIELSEAMVVGFNPNQAGEQVLQISYQGIVAAETFTVRVKEENAPKVASGVAIKVEPKKEYVKGESLDLTGGEIEVVYDDDETETIAMTDVRVTVDGYDANQIGEQLLSVRFMDVSTEWKVTVNAPEVVNKEKLQETIRQAELKMEEEIYRLADELLKETFELILEAAKEVEADEKATKEEVAEAVVMLSNAITDFMERAVKAVEIVTVPLRNKYDFGQELDLTGGELLVTYGNDRQEKMPITAEMIDGYEKEKAGLQTVKVVYKNRVAGQFEVEVARKVIPETPMMKLLKEAITRAEEAKQSDKYQGATELAKSALDKAMENAKLLLEVGGEEELLRQAIRELDEAIYDLSKTERDLTPPTPFVPSTPEPKTEEPQRPSKPAPKPSDTVKIEDEKIALSSSEKALADQLTENISNKEDKELIEKFVADKVTAKELVQKISDKALTEYAETVADTFKDESKDHWYAKELSAVRMLKLVKGYTDGTFGGENKVTGQEFVTMLVRLGGWEHTEKAEDWFAPYQQTAEKTGLLKNVNFLLSKELSREEVAYLAYNFMTVKAEKTLRVDKKASFTDKAEIADSYQEAISYLAEIDVLKGYEDGNYRPTAPVKRQEIVAILYRLLKNEK